MKTYGLRQRILLPSALRPSLSEVQSTAIEQSVPREQSETGISWFLIILLLVLGAGVGVIGGIVIGIFAIMLWRKSRMQGVIPN